MRRVGALVAVGGVVASEEQPGGGGASPGEAGTEAAVGAEVQRVFKVGGGRAGVAEGLGVDEEITSPTFILARTYSGLVPLTHADVYRMDTLGEVADLDLIEEAADGALMVEWGTAVEQSMPASRLVVHLEVSGQDTRILRFDPLGDWSDRPLEELEL